MVAHKEPQKTGDASGPNATFLPGAALDFTCEPMYPFQFYYSRLS